MDVEDSFRIVGACGRYQICCYLVFAILQMLLAWQMILTAIIGAVPEIHTTNRGKVESLDISTIVNEWDLFDKPGVVSFIQSSFVFGVLLGNLGFGQLSDKFGRKAVCTKALPMLVFLGFLTTFANNCQILAFIRFFAGIFEGGLVLVSFVHCQELLGSSVWSISGNILPGSFAVGIATLAWIGSSLSEWRDVCLATSLPGIFLCIAYLFIPESPRWLYSQGRLSEAQCVLKHMACKNGRTDSECQQITLRPKLTACDSKVKGYTLWDLFSSKPITLRTVSMAYIWFTASFVYYGLTMNSGQLSSNRYTSLALMGLIEIPAFTVCTVIIARPWTGRRRSLIGALLLACAACTAVMLTSSSSSNSSSAPRVARQEADDAADDLTVPPSPAQSDPGGAVKLVLALVGKLAIASSFSIVYIYASELFPTVVRNVGMGTSSVFARIGGMLAPFVPNLSAVSPALPFLVYGTTCFFGAVVAFFLPESLNRPIPDTLDDLLSVSAPDSNLRYNRILRDDDDDDDASDEETKFLHA